MPAALVSGIGAIDIELDFLFLESDTFGTYIGLHGNIADVEDCPVPGFRNDGAFSLLFLPQGVADGNGRCLLVKIEAAARISQPFIAGESDIELSGFSLNLNFCAAQRRNPDFFRNETQASAVIPIL